MCIFYGKNDCPIVPGQCSTRRSIEPRRPSIPETSSFNGARPEHRRMQVTRRYWTVAAVGAILVGWGAVVAGPVAVLGGAFVGAWLLARQYRFVRDATRVPETIAVDLSTRDRLTAEESAALTASAILQTGADVPITVTVAPPVGVTGDRATVTLAPGETEGIASTTLTWPVAGSIAVDDVTVTITDGDGGETILDLDFTPSDTHSVNIPSDGVLSTTDPYLSAATNVDAITIFYG